jgi:hypothetical protein
MKYQAHIKYIDGTLITVIWDDDKDRFLEEVELAKQDIAAYLGESDFFEYDNANLFIELV